MTPAELRALANAEPRPAALDEALHSALDDLVDPREPRSFADYLHRLKADRMPEPAICDGCGETAEMWSFPSRNSLSAREGHRESLCAACLGYDYGYDQAEEMAVRYMLSSAVAAAFASGAHLDLVRLAVEDAIGDHLRGAGRTEGAYSERARWVSPGASRAA